MHPAGLFSEIHTPAPSDHRMKGFLSGRARNSQVSATGLWSTCEPTGQVSALLAGRDFKHQPLESSVPKFRKPTIIQLCHVLFKETQIQKR